MPSRDWYLEHFDTTTKQGTLDLSDIQTSQLAGLSDRNALDLETQFIDELYGTDQARWDKDKDPTGYDIKMSGIEVTWGLDLVRVHDYEPSHPEYYDNLTKGEVDWKHYERDPKMQEALTLLREEGQYKHITSTHFFTDFGRSKHGSEKYSEQMKVDFIRDANQILETSKEKSDADAWKTDWEGKYDADHITRDSDGNMFIDGVRQSTISERLASGELDQDVSFTHWREDEDGNRVEYSVDAEGNVGPNAFDPIAGPPTAVVRPNVQAPDVQVKVPGNIPQSWGEHAKSTIKISDYAGGKE